MKKSLFFVLAGLSLLAASLLISPAEARSRGYPFCTEDTCYGYERFGGRRPW
jgi:hypothetical protein